RVPVFQFAGFQLRAGRHQFPAIRSAIFLAAGYRLEPARQSGVFRVAAACGRSAGDAPAENAPPLSARLFPYQQLVVGAACRGGDASGGPAAPAWSATRVAADHAAVLARGLVAARGPV